MATKKLLKRVRRVQTAPIRRNAAPVLKLAKKPKAKPRGRPFTAGNRYGLLSRFRKGEPSPNPNGRPSLKRLNEACRDVLARIVPREELVAAGLPISLFGKTYAELNAWVLAQEGMRGNVGSIDSLGDRAEGRPGTNVMVNDGQDSPFAILIASMDRRSDELGPPEGQVRKQLPEGESQP